MMNEDSRGLREKIEEELTKLERVYNPVRHKTVHELIFRKYLETKGVGIYRDFDVISDFVDRYQAIKDKNEHRPDFNASSDME